MKMDDAVSNCLRRRPAVALGLLIAPFAAVERAQAACAPTSPVNNATVTCTGTTSNQNTPSGYGSATDTGNTINVQSGASVTGTAVGVNPSLGAGDDRLEVLYQAAAELGDPTLWLGFEGSDASGSDDDFDAQLAKTGERLKQFEAALDAVGMENRRARLFPPVGTDADNELAFQLGAGRHLADLQ